MRNRLIHLSLWEDPSFVKLSIPARLLFISLFSHSDDFGKFRSNFFILRNFIGENNFSRAKIFKIKKELQNTFKNLHFFEKNNEEFGHFLNWNKYQKQDQRWIVPSILPSCTCETREEHGSDTRATKEKEKKSKVKKRKEKKRESRENFFNKNYDERTTTTNETQEKKHERQKMEALALVATTNDDEEEEKKILLRKKILLQKRKKLKI